MAFSPDGRTLAAGSADGTIWLWNVTDPAHATPIGQPLTGPAPTQLVAWRSAPTGTPWPSGSADGTVRLWNLTDPRSPLTGPQPADVDVGGVQPGRAHPGLWQRRSTAIRLWNLTDPAHPSPARASP